MFQQKNMFTVATIKKILTKISGFSLIYVSINTEQRKGVYQS